MDGCIDGLKDGHMCWMDGWMDGWNREIEMIPGEVFVSYNAPNWSLIID